MPTDPYIDSLDEQLRAANKALEGQVPDRYFDLLPNRILARLEDPTMQSDVNRHRTTQPAANPAVPKPVAGQRAETTDKVEHKEDSGLHDIKAMAQTTKQRISMRRISAQRPATSPEDDDVLATSSSSLRAVALPIAARPSQPAIVGNGSGSANAIDDAPAPLLADSATSSASSKPAMTAAPITPLPKKKSKAPIVAVGAAVAAMAAGVVGYVVLQNQDDGAGAAKSNAAAPMSRQLEVTPLEKKAEQPPAEQPAAPPAAAFEATGAAVIAGPDTAAATAAGGSGSVADDEAAKAKADKSDDSDRSRGRKDRDKDKGRDKGDEKDLKKAPEPTKGTSSTPPGQPGPADKQDQTLDDLLRGAGVDPDATKKQQAPKLDKKELTATDIRNAMSALNGKAQACHAKHGVSGSVPVKLTVAPSGEVKKTVVTGSFAGTPTGDCVQKAASGAKFPAWDGATMTVNYSYFLSE